MEDGVNSLDAVEDKLASVFASEIAHERGQETPEQPVEEAPADEPEIEAPVVAVEPEETPADQPENERLRDPETGQFTTEEKLYAGRYKSVEELERAVVEKEEFIQRQGTDVGSLRQELQQLRSALETRQAEPAPQPQALPQNWETLLDEDPAAAAEYAYQAGNQAALNEAFKSWNEISPGAPRLWAQNLELQQQVASLSDNFGQETADRAYREFARTHPDVEKYSGEMAKIAEQSPAVTRLLESDDPAVRTEVLDFLYTKASASMQARNADTLAEAQRAADAERDATLRQTKETAAVASATQSAAEKKPPTEGHEMLASIRAAYEQPDIWSGITTD